MEKHNDLWTYNVRMASILNDREKSGRGARKWEGEEKGEGEREEVKGGAKEGREEEKQILTGN